MEDCVTCGKVLGGRQHALVCQSCSGRIHRTCTDVSVKTYRRIQSGESVIAYTCDGCKAIPEMSDTVSTASSASPGRQDEVEDMELDDDDDDDEPSASVSRSESIGISFNCSAIFDEPPVLDESSIAEESLSASMEEDVAISYEVIAGGTIKGKDKLVDTAGYAYNIKYVRQRTTTWWCSVRNKTMRCPATVGQRGDDFTRGSHKHTHSGDAGVRNKVVITKKVKDEAVKDVFRPASRIVEDKFQTDVQEQDFRLPNPDYLVRIANRRRQKERPDEPRGFDFELDTSFLPPDFLRVDITVVTARHIIFATQTQLTLLQKAKRWYVDGTFSILREKDPFDQLYSVHAFIKKDQDTKQVPLAFIFMSRKSKKDYKKVLKKVKSLFPEPPAVKGFVMDFEPAMWGAVRKVFPEATVDGCAFHWTQAVWRNVQSLALGTEYMKKDATHHFIRQLLALPLLPAEHIVPVFCHLEEKATEHLKPLMKYIRNTWIQGSVWKPKDWSVFGQSVRTNNDCEGWHRRMNTRSVSPPPFYLLIHRLHKEASFLTHQLKLVSEKKLKKRQRTAYKKSQAKIFSCWDTYRAGEVSATKLLKKLSAVYAPSTH